MHGVNGGSNGSGHKRAKAPKRRNGVTKAQQDARRKIIAASGVDVRPEDIEAVIATLHR